MLRRALVALAVIGVAATTPITSAHQTSGTDPNGAKCGATFDPTTAHGTITVADGAETLYVDVRAINEKGYTWSMWIYAENNGHPGMQTDAEVPSDLDPTVYDNCTTSGHTALRPDLLVF